MAGDPCQRCRWHHDPVPWVEWAWLVRDTKPKPPGVQLGALLMLGTRLNARTGCGWTTRVQIAEDIGIDKLSVVSEATAWARHYFLLHLAVRGQRAGTRSSGSLWILTTPGNRVPRPPREAS